MGGQVLGGGAIVLVVVLLWLVYLLPSWASRHRYDAAERNAVRLNQALRILAETSETPHEVELELTARTAYAQQKLARRSLAERDELARRAQAEREQAARRTVEATESAARRAQRAEDEMTRRAQKERDEARLEVARRELAAARALPEARRARARRRARLLSTAVLTVSLAVIAWGVWDLVSTGAFAFLTVGIVAAVLGLVMLRRAGRVRVAAQPIAVVEEAAPRRAAAAEVFDDREQRTWAPRRLPAPLASAAGSQAAAVLDAEDARRALRQAAREEAMRARAERLQPVRLDDARRAASAASATPSDADIEAHVRDLLARRASGM